MRRDIRHAASAEENSGILMRQERENEGETMDEKKIRSRDWIYSDQGTGNTIYLGSKTGQIEDFFGRRCFCLTFESQDILDYEKKILSTEGTPYTLAMNFIVNEGKIKAFYDFTGRIQITDYIHRKKEEMNAANDGNCAVQNFLKILLCILNGLKGIEDHLIFSNRMLLEMGALFIDPNTENVVFAYLPEDTTNDSQSLQCKLFFMFDRLAEEYEEQEVRSCLQRFKEMVLRNNLGLEGMINSAGILLREISYITWSNQDFRRVELNQEHDTSESGEIGSKEHKHDKIQYLMMIVSWKENRKIMILQGVIVIMLCMLYRSGWFHITDFIGFCVITTGVDLWMVRSLKLYGTSRNSS